MKVLQLDGVSILESADLGKLLVQEYFCGEMRCMGDLHNRLLDHHDVSKVVAIFTIHLHVLEVRIFEDSDEVVQFMKVFLKIRSLVPHLLIN